MQESEQMKSIVRTALKMGGTWLIAHGVTNEVTMDAVIGAIVALIGAGASSLNIAKTEQHIDQAAKAIAKTALPLPPEEVKKIIKAGELPTVINISVSK